MEFFLYKIKPSFHYFQRIALNVAVEKQYIDIVKLLLSCGKVNINSKDI